MLKKEIVQTGKTVEEALASACLLLQCDMEDCDFEILDLPKKSFFGLKFTPAKVRVSMEVEEPVVEVKKEAPKATVKPSQQQKTEPSVKPKENSVSNSTPRTPQKELKQDKHVAPVQMNPQLQEGLDYLETMVQGVGVESEISVLFHDDGVLFSIEGEKLGSLIGRRGETLDALQYLTSLVVNRNKENFIRVSVDCGGYRANRKEALVQLAQRTAQRVLDTNISKKLEPMSSSERRIIHATISEIDGVQSTSVGTEPYRCVMIKTPTSKTREGGNRKNSSRGNDHSRSRRTGNREDRNRPAKSSDSQKSSVEETSTISKTPPEENKALPDAPLYGKIEL